MTKDFDFEKHPWGSFLFLDIETVAKVPELEENTPLYDSFVYKMRYAEEAQRKDFNSYNVKALYAEKAALYPEFGKIVAITIGMILEGEKVALITYQGNDEYKILTEFMAKLSALVALNPSLAICGLNIKFFDLRFIYIRSIVHQIVPVKGHISFTGFKPWEIKVADITDVWKQTSMYNAPLVCIAEALDLPSPKSDIDGSQVSSTYWKEGKPGLDRIVKYCERDVLTTINIARKLRFEPIFEDFSSRIIDVDIVLTPKKEEAKKAQEIKELKATLPPLFVKSLNTGHITEDDISYILSRCKRSSKVERLRLVEIVKAIHGKTEVDEELINQILTIK